MWATTWAAALLGALPIPEAAVPLAAGSLDQNLPLLPTRQIKLRAAGPQMLRLATTRMQIGSTMKEMINAANVCSRYTLGEPCALEAFSAEGPLHERLVRGFWMDRTEVTVQAYHDCVRLRRCRPIEQTPGAARFFDETFPASMVTLDDARQYCRFKGARLPEEHEFERAARGISRRIFPWGNLYNSRVSNHGRDGVSRTDARDGFAELAPVGSFPDGRTPEGLVDLAGNVAEWTTTPDAPYPTKEGQGPQQSSLGDTRVIRGGHFKSAPAELRGAARDSTKAVTRLPTLGFRCVRSIPDANAAKES